MAEDAPAQAPVSAPAAAAPAVTVKSEANDTTPAAPVKRERDDAAASEEAAMNAGSSEAGAKRGRFDRKGNHGGPRKDGAKGHWQQKKEERKAKGREHGRRGKPWEKKPKGPVDEEEAANAGSARPVKAEGEEGDGERRLPKKRAAVLVGYCGTGYSGMQIQTHGSRTIEGDLFAALIKAGAVSEENGADHRKVDVQRAARTDAGVHAAGNCISLKMILDPPVPAEFPDLTAYVNSFLPDQIRMWGFVRTMKSFQARTACDSRVYEYLLPSYCLLPPASDDPFAKTLDEVSPGWRDVVKTSAEFVNAAVPPAETDDGSVDPKARGEFERRRGWRVDEDTLRRFRELVAQYKGTHNFHNYTVGKPYKDRSVKRFMISLEVRDPAVYGDIEWISVRIHGQSFMLHQIRKMMSLAMLACRTGTNVALFNETFGPKRIHIPKAPPLGLLLEQPQFRTYNERARTMPKSGDEVREYVDFGKYEDQMHAFKVSWIYERLREVELETNTFHKWIRQIDCTATKAFAFLNTAGTIPDDALVTLTSKKYFGEEGKEGKAPEGGEDSDAEDAGLDMNSDVEG